MSETPAPPSNVVRFRGAWSPAASRLDQRSLMEAVYAAGSLPVAGDDRSTKVMATRLTIFGFVVIDEVQADGTARRLRASEAVRPSPRPWRVSKARHDPSIRPESLRPAPCWPQRPQALYGGHAPHPDPAAPEGQ